MYGFLSALVALRGVGLSLILLTYFGCEGGGARYCDVLCGENLYISLLLLTYFA